MNIHEPPLKFIILSGSLINLNSISSIEKLRQYSYGVKICINTV